MLVTLFSRMAALAASTALMSGHALASDCPRTPSLPVSNYPGFLSIMPHNHLARPAGKAEFAQGQVVIMNGRVLDTDCVPLNDVKVELWQANPQGRYLYATSPALANEKAVFSGSGRATTDNEGRFRFVTLYPGKYSYHVKKDEDDTHYALFRAPHVNVSMSAPYFKNAYRTSLYFEGDPENRRDHYLKRHSATSKARVTMQMLPIANDPNGTLEAQIDIILPRRNNFRSY